MSLYRDIVHWIDGLPNRTASKLAIIENFVCEDVTRQQVINAINNAQKQGWIEQPEFRRGAAATYRSTGGMTATRGMR